MQCQCKSTQGATGQRKCDQPRQVTFFQRGNVIFLGNFSEANVKLSQVPGQEGEESSGYQKSMYARPCYTRF